MGLSHGSGIFDIREQSIIKRKGFIKEELEYDKISQGGHGCSRPFSKIRMQSADSDFLYIQNNIPWFFTKVLCQEAQVGPIYIG